MSADGVAAAEAGTVSTAAAHSAVFFKEILKNGHVWTIRDDAGFPTATNASGETAMPFWSSESRAQKILASVPAYAGFAPEKLSLDAFLTRWLPGLEHDRLHVGVNWSGDQATGYDMHPNEVTARLVVKP